MRCSLALTTGLLITLMGCHHSQPDPLPKNGLAGQTLVSDGNGGLYFTGAYQFPLSDNIPVDINPPPLVELNPQWMARLVNRGNGYTANQRLNLPVKGSGKGMMVEAVTNNQGQVTSARIVEMGDGYQTNEVVTLANGTATIQLLPFGLFVSSNTPFELGSVPMTTPRIGGEGASPIAKWLGGDASFSFQLATPEETGGKDLYYMGFSDTFIGDYHGVPFNTFYGQRGTESYFIHNSFAVYDLNKFATTETSQGWRVPLEKDLTDTIQYYWSYTDLYDFDTLPSSSKYATLPASFFSYEEQPSWELWQMTGLRVRQQSKFIAMAYNNGSSGALTTLISVDTNELWQSPYKDGRQLQWDIEYFTLPDTLNQITSSAFASGKGQVSWTTALVYADGTTGASGDNNQAYLIGAAGSDGILARVDLAEIAEGNFDNVELWMADGQWQNHRTTEGKAVQLILPNTGGLNTGAGFYFNQEQQRWYTWIIPFTAPGNRQVGANFFEMYQSEGSDITGPYTFYQSVYQIPDPINGGSSQDCSGPFGCQQLNAVQNFPYNITVHPQLHSNPDQVLPLVYNINYGSLSQTARGGSSLFQRGGDAIYRPIVVGNRFCSKTAPCPNP